jgi:hypothetical protein
LRPRINRVSLMAILSAVELMLTRTGPLHTRQNIERDQYNRRSSNTAFCCHCHASYRMPAGDRKWSTEWLLYR